LRDLNERVHSPRLRLKISFLELFRIGGGAIRVVTVHRVERVEAGIDSGRLVLRENFGVVQDGRIEPRDGLVGCGG
jgi:hypothetical protein